MYRHAHVVILVCVVVMGLAGTVGAVIHEPRTSQDQNGQTAFALSVTPTRIEVEQGGNSTAIVRVIPSVAFGGVVVFSNKSVNLPRCINVDFVPRSLILILGQDNRSAAVFSAAPDCPVGSYGVIVVAESGEFRQEVPLTVAVTSQRVPMMTLLLLVGFLCLVSLGSFLAGRRIWRKPVRRPLSGAIGLRSEVGGREANEDSAVAMAVSASFRSRSAKRVLLAVADGMGGHRAGELASTTCLKTFSEYLHPHLESTATEDFSALMTNALLKANSDILAMATERPEASGMGTTFVGAIVSGNQLHLAWVGDSRAYLIRGGVIFRLTKDHAKVQEMVDQGQLSPTEARHHPDRNVITRSIGRRTNVQVDSRRLSFVQNDIILLCSDGLTDILDDDDILQIIRRSTSPQMASDQLIESCLRIGPSDNITALVAAF